VPITVRELAALVQGQVHGDGDVVVQAARPLCDAGPGDITFLDNPKHGDKLHQAHPAAVVVAMSVPTNGLPAIKVADPLTAFATIVQHLHGRPEPAPHGIDPRAAVDPTAQIGAGCDLYPFAVVGAGSILGARCRIHSGAVIGRDCRIGDDVVIHPNAVLYDGTTVGHRTIIHANAVLGADGFGYRQQQGRNVKVPQLGHVEIGDDVEIGACTTIDRGTFQATRVGSGTKIDNLVQIAHNCRIGQHNLLVSQMGIAGSSSTGDYVVIAGQAGVSDHVHIGNGTVIGARSGVARDVPAGQVLLGAPAMPEKETKRIVLSMEKLPDMRRDLRRIKQHLGMKDDA
jgi:UDP-3-O-[3-hydroxymyristoyl] glucosamine N-acyltransferase